MKKYVKNYLFAEPSFAEGVGRILDLGATLQEYNYSEEDADATALSNDWQAIGDDIRFSINQYEKQSTGKR